MGENLTLGDELSALLRKRAAHEQIIKHSREEIDRYMSMIEQSQKNIELARVQVSELDPQILQCVQAQMGVAE